MKMSAANRNGINVTVNIPAVTLLKPRRSLRRFIFTTQWREEGRRKGKSNTQIMFGNENKPI